MSITSVTGRGRGAAKTTKGPGNGRNQYVPLVTPHVIAAGTATLVSSTVTIVFPQPLAAGYDQYVVTPVAVNTAAASHGVTVYGLTNDSNGKFASFSIKGEGAADVVMWSVIKAGYGLESAKSS